MATASIAGTAPARQSNARESATVDRSLATTPTDNAPWVLYEHRSGRAVISRDSAFTDGDPLWTRCYPVEVRGAHPRPAGKDSADNESLRATAVDLLEVGNGLEDLGCRFGELVALITALRDWDHDESMLVALMTGATRLAEAGQERANTLAGQITRTRLTESVATADAAMGGG